MPEFFVEQNKSVIIRIDRFGWIDKVWISSDYKGPPAEEIEGHHMKEFVSEEDLQRLTVFLKGQRNIAVEFRVSFPLLNRRLSATLMDITDDFLLVQLRSCPDF